MATDADLLVFPTFSPAPVQPPSTNLRALGRKLSHHASFSTMERVALERWLGRDLRSVRERVALIEQGFQPSEINIVIEGWACRYRRGRNGRRQILAFYLPGDVCDFNAFVTPTMDSTIEAITRVQVSCISRSALSELSSEQPRLSQSLWWESLVTASIQREWMFNIGQRSARERIAHLICELATRMALVGIAQGKVIPFPLTQSELGDACAMTPEHTNRTLRELRDEGLVSLSNREATLIDWDRLQDVAGFDPAYLHIGANALFAPTSPDQRRTN
jgi:CRP-like cAMP-binding protein